jgi:hypothetical protein
MSSIRSARESTEFAANNPAAPSFSAFLLSFLLAAWVFDDALAGGRFTHFEVPRYIYLKFWKLWQLRRLDKNRNF